MLGMALIDCSKLIPAMKCCAESIMNSSAFVCMSNLLAYQDNGFNFMALFIIYSSYVW